MGSVVRLASARERPVVKACATCRHRKKDGFWGTWADECQAVGERCSRARTSGICRPSGEFWEPKIGLIPAIRKWLFGEMA